MRPTPLVVRGFVFGVLWTGVCLGPFAASRLLAQEAMTASLPALTVAQDERVEAHLLRVENARLRAALAQLQAELDTLRLSAEREALVEQLRRELGAPADATFDWSQRRFVMPSPPPQEPKP